MGYLVNNMPRIDFFTKEELRCLSRFFPRHKQRAVATYPQASESSQTEPRASAQAWIHVLNLRNPAAQMQFEMRMIRAILAFNAMFQAVVDDRSDLTIPISARTGFFVDYVASEFLALLPKHHFYLFGVYLEALLVNNPQNQPL